MRSFAVSDNNSIHHLRVSPLAARKPSSVAELVTGNTAVCVAYVSSYTHKATDRNGDVVRPASEESSPSSFYGNHDDFRDLVVSRAETPVNANRASAVQGEVPETPSASNHSVQVSGNSSPSRTSEAAALKDELKLEDRGNEKDTSCAEEIEVVAENGELLPICLSNVLF